MTTPYKTTSIIIVNWNSKRFIRECLNSIRKHEDWNTLQMIVVDSASFDGCGEMLEREFPDVEYIQSEQNIGFGRCNNLGFKHVSCEELLLLNPDTELIGPTLRKLHEHLLELPRVGILGVRLHSTDGSLQTCSVQAAPTPLNQALGSDLLKQLLPNLKLWGTSEAYRSLEPVSVESVSGAFMYMKTDTFRKVGGFNPEYFMYGEDMDLCLQVRRKELINYHVPTTRVIHHGGGSSASQISEFSTLKMREALLKYMELNHNKEIAYRYQRFQLYSARLRILLLKFTIGQKMKASIEKWESVKRWAQERYF